MCARAYRMTRRHESAEATRQRIVEATYDLHAERGIAATSMRDIAARADVAVGSVYHHFPTYDDVIEACGAYTMQTTRPPDPSIFDGVADSPAARLDALVAGTFAFYQRYPGLERIRGDRDKFPRIDAFLREEEDNRRRLLRDALAGVKVGKQRIALGAALLDIAVYHGALAGGLSHDAAVAQTCELLRGWLLPAARPRR